jgi:hypothetical protein
MPKSDTPQRSDDRETAEHKSRSVDERVPDHHALGDDPLVELPGAFATNIPQGGLGALAGDDLGPGEAALEVERKAQTTPIQRG